MTDREKLVELLAQACELGDRCIGCKNKLPIAATCKEERYGKVADHLLANGVTVREWIPVTERLPEKTEHVLMLFEHNMAAGFRPIDDEDGTLWCAYTDDAFYTDCDEQPTHWMPIPVRPPKPFD